MVRVLLCYSANRMYSTGFWAQLITLLAATSNMYSSRACAVCYVMIYDVLKHSTAQVVDAKQTRPSPAYERVWLHQTTPGVH